MTVIGLLIAIVVCCVLVMLVRMLPPSAEPMKQIGIAAICVLFLLWVLSSVGGDHFFNHRIW